MKRKRRTGILVRENDGLCAALSRQIEDNYEIRVVESPELCLVMTRVRESVRKSVFYLGEVLATEARVRIGDVMGFGIIQGEDRDRALQLAVIDAAISAGLPETRDWEDRIAAAEAGVLEAQRREFAMVKKSRVNFNIMEEYFDGIGKKS